MSKTRFVAVSYTHLFYARMKEYGIPTNKL